MGSRPGGFWSARGHNTQVVEIPGVKKNVDVAGLLFFSSETVTFFGLKYKDVFEFNIDIKSSLCSRT